MSTSSAIEKMTESFAEITDHRVELDFPMLRGRGKGRVSYPARRSKHVCEVQEVSGPHEVCHPLEVRVVYEACRGASDVYVAVQAGGRGAGGGTKVSVGGQRVGGTFSSHPFVFLLSFDTFCLFDPIRHTNSRCPLSYGPDARTLADRRLPTPTRHRHREQAALQHRLLYLP